MRIIKFRAWDTEEKRWWPDDIQDEWVNINTSGQIIYGTSDTSPEYGDSRFEVMQFTGYADVNKTEIYEGDIVKWKSNCAGYAKFGGIAIVKWKCAGFILMPWVRELEYADMEIIGNIFEDPDLAMITDIIW